MIIIDARIPKNQIFGIIDTYINKSLTISAELVANLIKEKIVAVTPFKSGNLRDAISILKGSEMIGYGRYDIAINTSKAPYALWIEYGKDAPFGIPYGNKGTKNFRDSSYLGANNGAGYIRLGLNNVTEGEVTILVTSAIEGTLAKITGAIRI